MKIYYFGCTRKEDKYKAKDKRKLTSMATTTVNNLTLNYSKYNKRWGPFIFQIRRQLNILQDDIYSA